jgi:hypothetical protein
LGSVCRSTQPLGQQSGVGIVQEAAAFTHWPLGSHVCGVLFEHCTSESPQTPWHTPPTHIWCVHPWPLSEQLTVPWLPMG